jgi:hypothetical protein
MGSNSKEFFIIAVFSFQAMKVVQEKTWYLVKESGGNSQLPVSQLLAFRSNLCGS